MKQRTDPHSWLTVSDCTVRVDEFPDGSFRFNLDGLDQLTYTDPNMLSFTITLKTTLPEAIMAVYQVISALDGYFGAVNIVLVIETLPDQRADRIERDGMSIPAQATAAMISGMGVQYVEVYDPHSPVITQCLIDFGVPVRIVPPTECFNRTVGSDIKIDHVVAVDKGAHNRAQAVSKFYGAQVIYADKKRVDGKIVGHVLDGTPDRPVCADDTIWVVDDLCDGGATFISIAELLRRNFTFGDLNLYVTHGLFSRGKEELFKHFTEIHSLFDRSEQNA